MTKTLTSLTAAEASITINKRTYRLSPLTLRDYAELEARVLSRRPDPLELAVKTVSSLPYDQQKDVLCKSMAQAAAVRGVSVDELHAYCRTREGLRYVFWLMLRRGQPEMTLEDAGRLMDESMAQPGDDPAAGSLQAAIEEGVGSSPENPSSPVQ